MEIKSISKISFSKLTNPLHVAFMNTIIAIINDFGAGRLGLKETLLDSFTKTVGEEQLIVNRSRASMHTKELDAYDAQRDNYFRAVIYKLKAFLYEEHLPSETPSEVLKSIEVNLLNVYPISIISDPVQVQTAKISGFIADVNRLIEPYIETIGIQKDLQELKKANELYAQAYISRVAERSESVSAAECRAKSEALYTQCVYYIGGRANEFIDEEVDEMAKMEIEKCADCLSKLNQAIKEFKWKYNSTSPDVDPDADLSELAENTEDAENSVND